MRRSLIRIFFTLCRGAGLFALARRFTTDRLRILCYHGFSLADEHEFRGSLFMTEPVFEHRMRYLRDKKYPILTLSDALAKLDAGCLPPNAVTITIDDGFFSVHRIARPLLVRYRFPATLYVTSYYVQKGMPIFRLLVSYIFWRATPGASIDLTSLGVAGATTGVKAITEGTRDSLSDAVRDHGERSLDETGRQRLAAELAAQLGVELEPILRSRRLGLITADEGRELEADGIELQLHTHRHRFPTEPEQAKQELDDNDQVLKGITGKSKTHFCYPSGEWSAAHWKILESWGVRSATTCDSRLARATDSPYALPRILDDMRVAQIEFEAEVSGFVDLLRDGIARFRRLFN